MSRKLTLGLCFLLAAACVGGFLWYRHTRKRAQELQQAVQLAANEMGHQMSSLLSQGMAGLGLDWVASLQGDTTTLTLIFTNRNPIELTDVVADRVKLGSVAPKEMADLPLKLGRLAPSGSKEVKLHFEKVPWNVAGDGLYARASVGLDLHEEWTTLPVLAPPMATNTTMRPAPSRSKSDSTGIPVELDRPSVEALLKRTKAPAP